MNQIAALLDFSEATDRVVDLAQKLALGLGAQLWLLHVEAPDPDFVGYEAGPQSVRDNVADEMHQHHRRLQQLADSARQAGIETTALLLQGPTVEALVEKARQLDTDLLVMGTHGRSGLKKLLLGSVSDGVLRSAHCPVLLVQDRS